MNSTQLLDNITSNQQEILWKATYYLESADAWVLSPLGIIGNVITLFIFFKLPPSHLKLYFMSITSADMLRMLYNILFYINFKFMRVETLCQFLETLGYISSLGSALFILIVFLDRMLYLKMPSMTLSIFNPLKRRCITIFLWLAMIVPRLWSTNWNEYVWYNVCDYYKLRTLFLDKPFGLVVGLVCLLMSVGIAFIVINCNGYIGELMIGNYSIESSRPTRMTVQLSTLPSQAENTDVCQSSTSVQDTQETLAGGMNTSVCGSNLITDTTEISTVPSSSRANSQIKNQSKITDQISKMELEMIPVLLAIGIFFVITNLPFVIIRVANMGIYYRLETINGEKMVVIEWYENDLNDKFRYILAFKICILLFTLNCTVKFLLYVLCFPLFKRKLCQLVNLQNKNTNRSMNLTTKQ